MSTRDDSHQHDEKEGSSFDPSGSELDQNLHTLTKKFSVSYSSSVSKAQARLEEELSAEKDARKEERFLFIVALFVMFNVWTLKDSGTWALPVIIGIMQLIALLILARRMGVEEIHLILNQLLPHLRLKASARNETPSERENQKSDSKSSASNASDLSQKDDK
ncbi:hypothetical protein [Vreelandella sp. EE27]